jgi:PTS system fructose-specific IIC component
MKIVAVTACPTGIAHSAMAAEALELAARDAGHEIEVEIQGAAGGPGLDPATVAAADGVIFAVDAGVRDRDRFAGLPAVEVRTRQAIDRAPAVVAQLAATVEQASERVPTPPMAARAPSASWLEQVRIWLMTGVSYMLPFVVAGGILIALGFAIGGATRVTEVAGDGPPFAVENWPGFADAFSDKLQLGALFFMIGATAFSMLVPILAGYIAFGMVDRPGIAPGVVAGLIANAMGAGFLGGLIGGLLAGAVVWLLMRIRVPGALSKMLPILVYPVVGTLVTAAVMVLVVGDPIAWIQTNLTEWLQDLQGSNAVLLGLLLGAMMAFDMGGPVNKAAYAFGLASLDSGNYAVMAAVMVAGMTPPLGLALATTLRPKQFTEAEHESGRAAWLLGASFITEGAIPFAAADPLRVIPSLMAGSAAAGAISLGLDAELRAPHGGVFVIGLIDNLPAFVLALAAGTVVTAAAVATLKAFHRSALTETLVGAPAAAVAAGAAGAAEAGSGTDADTDVTGVRKGGLIGA